MSRKAIVVYQLSRGHPHPCVCALSTTTPTHTHTCAHTPSNIPPPPFSPFFLFTYFLFSNTSHGAPGLKPSVTQKKRGHFGSLLTSAGYSSSELQPSHQQYLPSTACLDASVWSTPGFRSSPEPRSPGLPLCSLGTEWTWVPGQKAGLL